ncbi:hypothetical protein QAD02_007771 [Eretmocerus hayati]|uniref:Uncharacterized protein n=1 Tax=Eretmocerus hayati TaxID=131215 RepID=A0ACC2N706_9HYME|nr:hypothetical protein QAD02_007771 [Eretmocerus hayati]
MQIGLSLTPDFVRERLYEQHYQAAVELVKVFKRHGKEPRIYFFHPEICSGERKYVLYRDKKVFYLQSSDGKISPETFREDYGLSGAVQGLEKAAKAIRSCVYTRWRLWSDDPREYFIESFLLERPPNFLLKNSPVTHLDIDNHILEYIRIHKFYRLYRQWSPELQAGITVDAFHRHIDDSCYLLWRKRILFYNHLGNTFDNDHINIPE